jgi:hypothetical protein
MANSVTIVYQKRGGNFKTTVFNVALSGNYAAPEVVTLTSAASNPKAETVTGPSGAAALGAVPTFGGVPGYSASLTPTATAGQYNLTFAYGATALNGAYPAGTQTLGVEVDHDMQGL